MINKKLFLKLLFVFIFFSLGAEAAKVIDVKGKKVIVKLEGEKFKTGDILRVLTGKGKTSGLIKVTSVKANSVEGQLKGKAAKGSKVVLKPKTVNKPIATPQDRRVRPTQSPQTVQSDKKNYFGGMLGLNNTSAEVKNQSGVTVNLKGMGFSAMGYVDYDLMPRVGVRGLFGIEQFNVSSSDNCTTGSCEAKINYISGQAWGRYLFSNTGKRPWIGAGLSMMFPLSKDSTALKESSITTTSVFSFGGGLDIELSPTTVLPLQFEYNMYPSSDTVKASAMTARIGYGKTF